MQLVVNEFVKNGHKKGGKRLLDSEYEGTVRL